MSRLDAFAAHLVRFHPKTRTIDLALLRAKDTDPDVAQLVARGFDVWLDGCRQLAQDLVDEVRLAEAVDTGHRRRPPVDLHVP